MSSIDLQPALPRLFWHKRSEPRIAPASRIGSTHILAALSGNGLPASLPGCPDFLRLFPAVLPPANIPTSLRDVTSALQRRRFRGAHRLRTALPSRRIPRQRQSCIRALLAY